MIIPYRNELQATPFGVLDTAIGVAFLGSPYHFSTSLISATAHELGGVGAAILGTPVDLLRAMERTGSVPSIILVDEPTFSGLGEEDRALLMGVSGSSIGIAFNTSAFGIACHNDPKIRSRVGAIFPLNMRIDLWLSIVKLAAQGGSYICPEIVAFAVSMAQNSDPGDASTLTERQIEVLKLVAAGYSNKCIADRLGLSIHTVKLHLHNGSMRLGARNRTEAAIRYREFSHE